MFICGVVMWVCVSVLMCVLNKYNAVCACGRRDVVDVSVIMCVDVNVVMCFTYECIVLCVCLRV